MKDLNFVELEFLKNIKFAVRVSGYDVCLYVSNNEKQFYFSDEESVKMIEAIEYLASMINKARLNNGN